MSSKARKPKDKKDSHNLRLEARLGSRNYVVAVGLGTPRRIMSLEFDTASSLTWTQCQPCLGSCCSQILLRAARSNFDPSDSSTYSNISCNSAECSQLRAATRVRPGCDTNTWVYGTQYGDGSYTVGFLCRDKLALSAVDVIPDGQNNKFNGKDAGILGLGRSSLSIVYQTAKKYGKYSYSLPSTSSSTGHLTPGKSAGIPTTPKFTPFKSSLDTIFYVIDILSITVGGRQ